MISRKLQWFSCEKAEISKWLTFMKTILENKVKGTLMRFENLSIYLNSYKNYTQKVSHS